MAVQPDVKAVFESMDYRLMPTSEGGGLGDSSRQRLRAMNVISAFKNVTVRIVRYSDIQLRD